MKIKFKDDFLTKNGTIKADKEVDMDTALGKQYVQDGYAVEVKPPKKPRGTKS